MERRKNTVTFTITLAHGLIVLALVIGFGAGFGVDRYLLSTNPTTGNASILGQQGGTGQASAVQLLLEGRPFLGPADAPVTIVEFTDYQCLYCAVNQRENIPRLLEEYKDRVRYVVLNFPITSIHPGADQAGQAAECAADQGKFWEYHDMLFQNQGSQHAEGLKEMARQVGLDAGLFNSCLDSGAKSQLVLQDLQQGRNYGVRATPTFFINGREVVGFLPYDDFKSLVDQAAGG